MPSEYCTVPLVPGHCAVVNAGTSARLFGNVTGRLPDGFTSPNSSAAMALPSCWPGYQFSSTPATEPSHGMVTAEPVLSTTIVFGFAAATWEISVSSSPGRLMLDRSLPSDSKLLANTTATDEFRARVTAAWMLPGLSPGWDCTLIPEPARLVMPCNGVTVPDDDTPALPPPAVCGDVASVPITAIDLTVDVLSGNAFPLFLSRTVPSSAMSRAVVWCAVLVTVAPVDAACCGLSNRPNVNSSVRMRLTMVFSVAIETWPLVTAVERGVPRKLPSGICMSRPAFTAATVECVPPQSDVTKPGKPNSLSSALFSSTGFSHASVPLTKL